MATALPRRPDAGGASPQVVPAASGTADYAVPASLRGIGAQAARAAAAARVGRGIHPGGQQLAAIDHHALATGFARAFLVAAGIALLTLAVNTAAIRIRRADLAGAPPPAPAAPADPAPPAVTAKDTNDSEDPDDNSGS